MRVSDAVVRTSGPEQLDELVSVLGQRQYFADRFARQDRGEGVVLVAWSDGHPVGDVYLWCAPAHEPEIRAHLPGVPLLNHLEVHAEHRGRGIGTAIIERAELVAARLGHQRIALGVAVDNSDAHRLYRRLGYADWGYGLVDTSYVVYRTDGATYGVPETLHVLTKALARLATA